MLKQRNTDSGIPVFYSDPNASDASLLAATIDETARMVNSHWSLPVPVSCSAYIITSWQEFVDHSVPNWLKVPVWVSKPLWRRRIQRVYELAAGWMMPWPGKPTVGIKPISVIENSKTKLGEQIFAPVQCPREKFRHVACHEFTHACTAHLKLPAWLNEGLAMQAVDLLAGVSTVNPDTQSVPLLDPTSISTKSYRQVSTNDPRSLLTIYTAGYWATKRIDDLVHDQLVKFLSKRRSNLEANELASLVVPG